MRLALAAALASLLALGAARAPAARGADAFPWKSPDEVLSIMEKQKCAGVFYFDVAGEQAATSLSWQFTQPAVVEVIQKLKLPCCKIDGGSGNSGAKGGKGGKRGGGGGGATKPASWGSYDGLARELGVGKSTMLVVAAFDKMVLTRCSEVIKRIDFEQRLADAAAANTARAKLADESARDLAQAEKWVEAKRYGDATRRVAMLIDRDEKIPKALIEKAKDLDGKLDEIGRDRLAEGKRLLDAGKHDEAAAILEDTANAFAKYDSGKEAKELLKKAKKAA